MIRHRILICALLSALVFLAYAPVLHNGFTGYDDPDYVTANPHVTSGLRPAGMLWALTSTHAGNWHPVTWISHMADCSLFGLAPAGHHLMSLLLHITNTLLLFLALAGVTGAAGRSAFVALLFGLHPVHVESVAWAAERKDVLGACFLLLALYAYRAWLTKPSRAGYFLVAALFAAGLATKPMLVTFPVLLLVIDRWPLRRAAALGPKIPFAVLSALACAATVWAQARGGAIAAQDQLPVSLRLENAALSYVRYIGKTLWPTRLAVFYPFPQTIDPWTSTACALLLAAITWGAFRLRHRRPWLLAGWCWYLVALLPVIGLVQAGMQAMADRYLYMPIVGLLVALIWEGHDRLPSRLAAPIAGVAAVACAILTWNQVQVWKDGVTLFAHATQVTDANFVAHDNLGVELDRRGRAAEALAEYREAIRIRPGDRNGEANFARANFAVGERLFAQGKLDEALARFREGLPHQPQNALAHTYVGLILTQQQQLAASIDELRAAIRIDPTLARAQMGLGVALAWSQRPGEAAEAFGACLRYDPSNVEAYYDLGLVQQVLGRPAEAIQSFDASLRLNPAFAPAREARAGLLLEARQSRR